MKTEYKYIKFDKIVIPGRKTAVYTIVNISSGTIIGRISWNGQWRQYCFYSESETVFSKGCLLDIIDFIDQLNDERGK
jgi:hypothetical protein